MLELLRTKNFSVKVIVQITFIVDIQSQKSSMIQSPALRIKCLHEKNMENLFRASYLTLEEYNRVRKEQNSNRKKITN